MKTMILFLPCLIMAIILPSAFAAEKPVNFSGTWIPDARDARVDHTSPEIRKLSIDTVGNVSTGDKPAQTDLGNYVRELLQAAALQIIHTDNELQTIRRFPAREQDRAVIQKFKLDGSQCLNVSSNGQGEFQSRSNWKKNKLIHSGSQIIYDGALRLESYVKEEYSLSKNGKKLTIKTTATGSRGVTTIKQVFHRQD